MTVCRRKSFPSVTPRPELKNESKKPKVVVQFFPREKFSCVISFTFIYDVLLSIHPILILMSIQDTSCVRPRAHSIDGEVSSSRCEIRFLKGVSDCYGSSKACLVSRESCPSQILGKCLSLRDQGLVLIEGTGCFGHGQRFSKI